MKELNKIQNIAFQIGGLLLVVGAIMPMLPEISSHAATTFTLGALLFGSMQLLQRYEGSSVVLRRLRRQQIIGAAFLIVTAAFMLMRQYNFGPCQNDEWKITLLVAVILELYTAFRIPQELDKEA